MIILYGGADCPACKSFKSWLETKKIPFEYLDVDERDNSRALSDAGIRSIPVVKISDGWYVNLSMPEFTSLMERYVPRTK